MSVNEQDFYPPGGDARANIVTRPDDLPRFISQGLLQLQDALFADHNNDAGSFFDRLSYDGARVTLVAVDTWTEVLNLSGAGLLGNVVASHGREANKTVGIQIIVDGVLWEWEETLNTAYDKWTLVVGAISSAATQVRSNFPTAARYADTASAFNTVGPQMAPVSHLHSSGSPVLAFTQSLVVNVKCSHVVATEAGNVAAATYVMR